MRPVLSSRQHMLFFSHKRLLRIQYATPGKTLDGKTGTPLA